MTKIDWRNIEGETRKFGPGMVELVLTARGEMVNVICHARQVPYVVPALKDWVLRDGPAEPPECEINESFTSSTEGWVAAPATHGQKAYRMAKELADHLAVTPAQPARSALEQYDLDQSADYRKGYEDGRLKGFEVGHRYAKEQAPAQQPLTDEQIAEVAERMEAVDPTSSFWRDFARAIEAHIKGEPK